MPSHIDHFSPADLLAAGVRLRPVEAVTIVRELMLQVLRGEIAGIPSQQVVRLSSDGLVFVEGPVGAGDREVSRAAHLLDALLPPFDASPEERVPGALRLVAARALGTLDLPPYSSLEAFAEALARFAAQEPPVAIREAVARCASALEARRNAPAPAAEEIRALVPAVDPERDDNSALTVSDIRRARRATGLTLSDIARRSRIPLRLLREMEWGYLVNWPDGTLGRTRLVQYARAAGLDDELVIRAVWPLVEEFAHGGIERTADPEATITAPSSDDWTLVPFVPADVEADAVAEVERPSPVRLVAALAIPALLAIGVLPILLDREAKPAAETTQTESTQPSTVKARRIESKPVPKAGAADARSPGAAAPASGADPISHSRLAGPSAVTRGPVATVGPSAPAHSVEIPHDDAYSPSFTNAGSAIFYHAKLQNGSALMRADTDGQGAILRITSVVDDRAQNFHARPSPDGSQIAFDSDRDGERAVYIADADGRNVRRVSGDGFAAIPSWSPDGRTLAYVRSEPGHPQVWNLWTTELQSGRTRRLTSFKYGQPWGGSWFPDGRRIAYSHEDDLIVLDTLTGAQRVYRTPVKGRLVRTPAVSPDGRRIVFQVYRDGAWLLDLPDGGMRKVLSDPSAEEYTWAPDGRQVAYHSRRTGNWGVWIMGAR